MYNGSITFPVDKCPHAIMPFISISIISSPFVPTNHSSPFSFYLQLYHEMCFVSTTGTSVPGPSSGMCRPIGSSIAVVRGVRELAPKQDVQDNPENV